MTGEFPDAASWSRAQFDLLQGSLNVPLTAKSRIVSVGGISTHVLEEGEGPAIAFLHGYGGNVFMWRQQISSLAAEGFRVVAIDMLSHGRTEIVSELTADALVGHVNDTLTALDFEGVVVGQSLGGAVARGVAALPTTRARGFVMAGAAGFHTSAGLQSHPDPRRLIPGSVEEAFQLFKPASPQLDDEAIRLLARSHMLGRRGEPETEALISWATALGAGGGFDIVDGGAQGLPSLIIWGDADVISPVARAHALHAALPASTVSIYEGVGHMPHLEAPVRFNRELSDWVTGVLA